MPVFLRGWADAVTRHHRTAEQPAPDPFDLLVFGLGLEDSEADLLLLAGLPEEHEGLADVFRTLHPQHVPRPGVGLAVRLVEASGIGPMHSPAAAGRRTCDQRRCAADPRRRAAARSGCSHRPRACGRCCTDTRSGLRSWTQCRWSRHRRAWMAGFSSLRCAGRSPRSACPGTGCCLVTGDDETIGAEPVRGARRVPLASAWPVPGCGRTTRPACGCSACMPPPAEPSRCCSSGRRPRARRPARLELDGLTGPVLVCAAPGAVRLGASRPVLAVPLGRSGSEDRRAAWRAALPEAAEQAPELAARHPLDPAITAQVALDLRSFSGLAAPDPAARATSSTRSRPSSGRGLCRPARRSAAGVRAGRLGPAGAAR